MLHRTVFIFLALLTTAAMAQIAALKDDPLNGGKAMVGNEYLMNTRAVLIMAVHLEKEGLVNIRATYPELDISVANVDRMVHNGGGIDPRASVVL